VSVDVFDTATLNSRSAVIRIDGVARTATVTHGPATGHWECTETLVDGVWTVQWVWVEDTGGSTKATLSCYPPTLADGFHTVVATVRDVNGVTLSTSWSFTIAVPPRIGAMKPAPGVTVSTLTPIISAKVTDRVGVPAVSATVIGAPATAGTPVSGVDPFTGCTRVDGPVIVCDGE
jgi:hypothetical protein